MYFLIVNNISKRYAFCETMRRKIINLLVLYFAYYLFFPPISDLQATPD